MVVAALALAVTLVLGLPADLLAQTPAESARALIARYDQDPARLERARDVLEAALKDERRLDTLITLSYVYFLIGEIRARSTEEKLAAYDRGRELGKRAVELAPRDEEAHLWYAINTGRWGQTRGVFRSLFLLPTVREEIDIILALNPRSVRGRSLAGNVLMEAPAFVGGDRQKAEDQFRRGIEHDPHFTGIRVDLARLLIATNRRDEARQQLTRVLEEKAPTNVADWHAKDRPRARELLDSLRGAK
jgi:tetratricopeptide (TPR) repeat protein